jgi:glutamate carboxypeptidase
MRARSARRSRPAAPPPAGGAPRAWLAQFERALPRLRNHLEFLVGFETPSDDSERVTQAARWLRDQLKASGIGARTVPCPPRGDAVLAHVGGEGGTLLLGHLDTVWPVGSLAEMPFAIKDGRATGPGVFDMKSGIAIAMGVLEALVEQRSDAAVSLLLVPDEEAGSQASRALTLDIARKHRCVLVLEPSLNGAAKVARKGVGFFDLQFRGRPAHAGLDPEAGASALAELARCVLYLEKQADSARGTTVTPTVARSGTTLNVVPESATLAVDVRAWTQEEAARVTKSVRGYRTEDARVTFDPKGGFNRPPMEPTPKSQALYERMRGIASSLGFDLGAARVGGGSDGNLTAAAGVPTLDGLGPLGDGAHARHEHVVIEDLPRRAAMLAQFVSEAA